MFVPLRNSKRCQPCSRYSLYCSLLFTNTTNSSTRPSITIFVSDISCFYITFPSAFSPFDLNSSSHTSHTPSTMSPPTSPGRRERKIPLWASRLASTQCKLEYILQCLEDLKTPVVTNKVGKYLGIELSELDLETGTTTGSTQAFFQPRDDGKASIANTLLNPDGEGQDDFTSYRRLRRDEINEEMGLQTHLATAFKDCAFGLVRAGKPQLEWKAIQWVFIQIV